MTKDKKPARVLLAAGAIVLLACCEFSCSAEKAPVRTRTPVNPGEKALFVPPEEKSGGITALAAIAETERSHRRVTGLSFREAEIREGLGDYAGAVIAAFKELLWDYSLGGGQHDGTSGAVHLRDALKAIRELYTGTEQKKLSGTEIETAIAAVDCAQSFINGDYPQARSSLGKLFLGETEIDSFPRWMELVCLMEEGGANDAVLSEYSAIRARYESFPPYWYFGARNMPDWLNGEFAERCINSAVSGPYAGDAREILAVFSGLRNMDGSSLLSQFEIEELVVKAVNENNPQILSSLLPLLALNDNPYTLYASGALRALAAKENFKDWFAGQEKTAVKSSVPDRLADRLRYIARG
jgi:hypothetical protein